MVAEEPEPEPHRGFFARLFRRRKAVVQSESEQPAIVEIDAPEQHQDEDRKDIAAELKAAEEQVAAEQVAAEQAAAEQAAAEQAAAEQAAAEEAAAEQAAAEQAAAEEVTAVLTAALDRLGAAHHRPFSRA